MQDKSPLVSVIITCFNLEKYISRAIGSCINQTLSDVDYEIIVVDDASTDNSRKIIEMYDGLVTAIYLEENCGVSHASNVGIKEARGKYVVRVDGDDYINTNFLFVMSQFLQWNEDIGFVYCDHIVVDNDMNRKQEINNLEKLLDHGAGVMFRKEYLEAIGLYDESLRNREDYDLLLRYMKNFDGHRVKLPYYRYVSRTGSLSTQKDLRAKLKEQIDERQGFRR
jgi:glycosyltransferase involved in cell wall biosynthesis